MVQANFDPWSRICSDGHAVFMEHFQRLFKDHLARCKEEAHNRLYRANRSKPVLHERTVIVLVLLEVVRALLRLLSLRLHLVLQVVLYLSSEVRLGSIAVWLPCLGERKSVKIVELVVPKGM